MCKAEWGHAFCAHNTYLHSLNLHYLCCLFLFYLFLFYLGEGRGQSLWIGPDISFPL